MCPIVVVDTSAILDDPDIATAYPEAQIIVPLTVIRELDAHKKRRTAQGMAARHFLNAMENNNAVSVGIAEDVPQALDSTVADHRIIGCAWTITKTGENTQRRRSVVLVSNDTALRILARSFGIKTESHYRTPWATRPSIQEVSFDGSPRLTVADAIAQDEQGGELLLNEFAVSGASIYRRTEHGFDRICTDTAPKGAKPKGVEQSCALDLLRDPAVPLVALAGSTGSGKTHLALAQGLADVRAGKYDQVVVLRPITVVGREELGFLPGTVAEKIAPHFALVLDLLQHMGTKTPTEAKATLDGLVKSGKLVTEPVSFLRGRTLTGKYVILDECQNMDRNTVKSVISRAGQGTKVVLTGDTGQIDVAYSTPATCGLTAVINAFTGQAEFGRVNFQKTVRSNLASLAGRLL